MATSDQQLDDERSMQTEDKSGMMAGESEGQAMTDEVRV